VAATLESSGPHSASFLSQHVSGRQAQLLVVALRDTAVLIGKQLASDPLTPKWRLQIAHTATVAAQRMSETNFDLVLVDLSMADFRIHVPEIVAAAGTTLVYGLCDDEHGEIALSARREGIADVLSTQHLRGPSTVRLMRLLLESAQAASTSRLLAAAVEGAPVAYAMTDALQSDMPIIYVNDHFVALTGYQPREVIGRNCRMLQGPLTDSRDVDRLREAIRRAQPVYVELINYRKDGQPFWNGVLLRPIRAANGTVTHFVATLHDMSERRRTEELLERSARLHRLLVEASGDMIVYADPDGQLRAPIAGFDSFTGLRYEDYRSGNWSAVVHPDDRRNYVDTRLHGLAQPAEYVCTYRLWHAASAAWHAVESHMLPLFDSHGHIGEWIGTLRTCNAKTGAVTAQQGNEFLSAILDSQPQRILFADRDGVVRWMNRACANWLGADVDSSKNQLLGQPLMNIVEATDRELLPRRMQAVLAGQRQRYNEVVTWQRRSATLDVCYLPCNLNNADLNGFLWIGSDPLEDERIAAATQRWLRDE
jgi:PAS domain S-box-containing protein